MITKGRSESESPRTLQDLSKLPLKARLVEARRIWARHPRALRVNRVVLLTLTLVAVGYVVYRFDLILLAFSYPTYSLVIGTITAVATLLSLRGRETIFNVYIPPDDPGHLNLPYFPDGTPARQTFRRYRLPMALVPGTYPPESSDMFGRRWGNQWTYSASDGTLQTRAIELKFASIAVQALRGDAIGCHVEAKIVVHTGSGGAFTLGVLSAVDRLNWYRNGWDEPLARESVDAKGESSQPYLDRLFTAPSIGFNEYLRNPEITINKIEWQILPLFYMRSGQPEVHLCGQQQGLFAGLSSDSHPIEFDLEVTIRAQHSRPFVAKLRCSAMWDVLTVDELNG